MNQRVRKGSGKTGGTRSSTGQSQPRTNRPAPALIDRPTAESLRHGEARFRALVETATDWIWEVDARGAYTYMSPKVKDLLGYDPGEVIGKTPFDLMLPEEAARLRPDVPVILASGYSEQELNQRFRAGGRAGFIHKPYEMPELCARVRAVMSVAPAGPAAGAPGNPPQVRARPRSPAAGKRGDGLWGGA